MPGSGAELAPFEELGLVDEQPAMTTAIAATAAMPARRRVRRRRVVDGSMRKPFGAMSRTSATIARRRSRMNGRAVAERFGTVPGRGTAFRTLRAALTRVNAR